MIKTSNINRILLSLLISGLFFLITPAVFAGGIIETYSIADYPSAVTESHQLDTETQVQYDLTIERNLSKYFGSTETSATAYTYVFFSSGSSGDVNDRYAVNTNGTDYLHYNLYDTDTPPNLIKDVGTYSTEDDYFDHLFPAVSVSRSNPVTQVHTHSFILEIPEGQEVPAGTYSDSIDITYYHDSSLEETVTMNITITVEQSIGLSIVDVGASFDPYSSGYSMDFGDLIPGEFRQADAVALSNSFYSISAYSYNGSFLIHENPIVTETIPYTFDVDGSSFDLSAAGTPVTIVDNAPATSQTGTAHTLTITIGSFNWVPAGDYADSLVFEIIGN